MPRRSFRRVGARSAPIHAHLLGCLLVSGCASVNAKVDYDRSVTFGSLQSYAWLAPVQDSAAAPVADPFLERRLRRSVGRLLQERGFEEGSGAGEVDFLVRAYATGADVRREGRGYRRAPSVSFGVGFGFPVGGWYGYPYWRWRGHRYWRYPYWGYPTWGYPFGWGYPFFGYPYFYPWVGVAYAPIPADYGPLEGQAPGTLVVDILDGRTGELIWRGWAEGALALAPDDPAELPSFIDETIGKIMKPFPPPG